MFRGLCETVLDEERRLQLPECFRAGLAEGVVVLFLHEQALRLAPASFWEQVKDELSSARPGSPPDPVFADVDDHLTITLPELACDRIDLAPGSAAVTVGVGPMAEVWSASVWDRYRADRDAL